MSLGESNARPEGRGGLARAGARFVGFFDSVGKVVGAISGVLVLLGALGVVTLAGDDDDKDTPKPKPVKFSTSELAPVSVDRYAFTFQHPTTWEREDSFNEDGAVFHSPDEAVELRAYGVLAHEGPSSVLERVDYMEAQQKTAVLDEGGQILSDDIRFVAWEGPAADRTPATRLIYQARDQSTGKPVTTVVMMTTQEGRDVTISCQVVRNRFREFEGACNQLVASLKLEPFL